MICNMTRGQYDSIEALNGIAALLGRSRIAYLSDRLYASPAPGPIETASVLASNSRLCTELIRIANTVRHGAGIPAVNIEAAIVRLGAERSRALAMAYESACALSLAIGDAIDFGAIWRQGIARGCFARALAMNSDRRVAGEAFLVGLLQDAGSAVLAAARPAEYERILDGGDTQQRAALELQAFGLNHIHVGQALLQRWHFPATVIDAIGRHHTRPPMSPANSPAMRLWQIAYVAGALPIGPLRTASSIPSTLPRLLGSAFNIQADRISTLIDQTAEEYRDIEGLFARYFTTPMSVADLLEPATTMAMDCATPTDIPPAPHHARELVTHRTLPSPHDAPAHATVSV